MRDFYEILTFKSRSFPDVLWEKNAAGDKEVGGLYNSKTLKQPKSKSEKFRIFIAFYLNKTRLIDNI